MHRPVMLQVLLHGLTDDDRYIIRRVQFPHGIGVAAVGVEFPIAGGDTIRAFRLNWLVMYQNTTIANDCAAEVYQPALHTTQSSWGILCEFGILTFHNERSELRTGHVYYTGIARGRTGIP